MMIELIEIKLEEPRPCSIVIPKKLYDEISKIFEEGDFNRFIIEALAEGLKKVRFRNEYNKKQQKTLIRTAINFTSI